MDFIKDLIWAIGSPWIDSRLQTVGESPDPSQLRLLYSALC
jgi:hypothetical protein